MIDPDDFETEDDFFRAVVRDPLRSGTIGSYYEPQRRRV